LPALWLLPWRLFFHLAIFAASYQHIAGSLETEAELTSHIVTNLINTNPELWQFEQLRLEELMARRMRNSHLETRRILDRQNRFVAESVAPLKSSLDDA